MAEWEVGLFPSQTIERLAADGIIAAGDGIENDQVQPASLDLRLGKIAYRIRASFLPGPEHTVHDKLDRLALHTIDLTTGAVLETGCVYLVPLKEQLRLPAEIAASTNPKSSTGRLDVFTRVIADRGSAFDSIAAGYHGPLFAEISPRTFPVLVREGSRLSQIRFRSGEPRLSDADVLALHEEAALVSGAEPLIASGLCLSIDLAGPGLGGLIGYRAKRHSAVIDLDRRAQYEVADFWEPIAAGRHPSLILDPDEFYILASKEAVHVPPAYAAEMVAFDPLVGEFRVHYAGFFDPGFGHSATGGAGSRAVLEVRSHEVPFILEDGQVVGRLVYERLCEIPDRLYGAALGSNYQAQSLKLSKHFRAP